MTTFWRRQQQATELVGKWISKKVTKYLLLLNIFYSKFYCIPVLLLLFPNLVQQHYVGEVGKSITFLVWHIFSISSVPNIVEIGQHT